jgi:micrococcal nuclease
MKTQTIALILFSLTLTAFTGKVVGVSDGDTITVLKADNTTVKVRLSAIDCPETAQDFGAKAKAATSRLCYGKTVTVESEGTDRYGRTLAFVYVDGLCVNKELLKLGMAWHYKKYSQDKELAALEDTARRDKVGLWSQASPVAPWDFRRK